MRLNKTDGLTIGFITIAGFAILLNGIFREPPAQLTDQLQHPIDIEIGNITPTEISGIAWEEESPKRMVEINEKPATLLSFSQAFSEARRMRGPGAIFEWNGKSFTTSFAEELIKPGNTLDSTQINLVMNEPQKK